MLVNLDPDVSTFRCSEFISLKYLNGDNFTGQWAPNDAIDAKLAYKNAKLV